MIICAKKYEISKIAMQKQRTAKEARKDINVGFKKTVLQSYYMSKYLIFLVLIGLACADEPIGLINCGGVIGRDIQYSSGILIARTSYIPIMLQQGRCQQDINITNLLPSSQLQMSDENRRLILSVVAAAPEDRIILAHGTESMVNTATLLGENINSKTVVLVGAMVPYNEENSDAPFNIAYAVAAVQLLPYGVYICMQGTVFNWQNVKFNHQANPPKFEVLTPIPSEL